MTTFDDREKSFEKKFVLDEEKIFKINSRRNRYLAEWVSNILNYNEDQTKNYISEVIKSDFEKPGDDDVFQKVKKDLSTKNISDIDLRSKMDEFFEKARKEFS
ncbi:MAG: DUF1476 domain-containing protein [Pelagibacteraceae bacterium]